MKILMHSGFAADPFTGIGRVVCESARALRCLGAEVDVLWGSGGGENCYLEGYFRPGSLPEVVDPWWGSRKFQEFIVRRSYDVVHSHARWAYHSVLARRLWGGRHRILTHDHGLAHALYPVWREEARRGNARLTLLGRLRTRAVLRKEAFYHRRADAVVVVSQGVYDDVMRFLGLPARQVRVIPNGVDVEAFRPNGEKRDRFRALHRLDRDDILCLFIGSPAWRKGLPYLLQAWKSLPERYRICLVGLNPAEGAVVAREVPPGRVIDCGLVREMEVLAGIYCGADIFVFPSLYEGLPLVLLEAMSSGLACVVSDCNGARDVVEDGKNGTIVPIRDVGALQEALRRLRNKAIREEMGRRARETALNFTWEEMARRLLGVYREVISK